MKNKNAESSRKNERIRRCVVCMEGAPKNELLRIVKTDDGVVFDKSGKMNGRGAYVMKDEKCLLSPKLRDKLQAALKINIKKDRKLTPSTSPHPKTHRNVKNQNAR